MKTTKEILAFRITPDLLRRIERAARREDRTLSYIARRTVERELARLERAR